MTACVRLLAKLLAFLSILAALVAVGAAPASANGTRTLSYVALGDSYAAGQGAGYYRNDCLQSRLGYPARLDALRTIRLRANAACSGATTADVIATQASALNRGTRLVTLTVGGNDLNVAGVAAACAAGPSPGCQAAINSALALLAAPPGGTSVLGARLAATYTTVATAAPKARILVTGYPYLFEPPAPDNPNAATIVAVNNATTALNATIAAAVAGARAAGAAIEYVDVTGRFAAHGIGSAEPFLVVTGPDAFHPNAAGYRAYAHALIAALRAAP